MLWILAIAIICSVCAVCSGLCYFIILRWKFKGKYSLSDAQEHDQINKYIVTPSKKYRRKFYYDTPYTTAKPINVQPNSAKLNLRALTIPTDPASNNNNSGFGASTSPEVYQTPLISTYEGENKRNLVWKRTPKRSLKDSYSEPTNTITATITASEEADTNTNLAQNSHSAEPELSFSIFYDSASKDLHVTVIRTSNLPVSKWFKETRATQHFRVKVRVEPWEAHWRTTRHVGGTREPVFGETFIVTGLVHNKLRECTVNFVVVEFEEYQHCWTVVGEVSQTLIDFRANQLMKTTKKLLRT